MRTIIFVLFMCICLILYWHFQVTFYWIFIWLDMFSLMIILITICYAHHCLYLFMYICLILFLHFQITFYCTFYTITNQPYMFLHPFWYVQFGCIFSYLLNINFSLCIVSVLCVVSLYTFCLLHVLLCFVCLLLLLCMFCYVLLSVLAHCVML